MCINLFIKLNLRKSGVILDIVALNMKQRENSITFMFHEILFISKKKLILSESVEKFKKQSTNLIEDSAVCVVSKSVTVLY